MNIAQQLSTGLEQLNLKLDAGQQTKLIEYINLLHKWNRAYNLTALQDPLQMLSHHLLDSLSVAPYISAARTILDVGTGAGLPGLVLAIAHQDKTFTLIDSQQKKITFVQHVISSLQINNVIAVHGRVEQLPRDRAVDMVISRAFASLNEFVTLIGGICTPQTQIVAMKGKLAQVELELQQLPRGYKLLNIEKLEVPLINAERCLVFLCKQEENLIE